MAAREKRKQRRALQMGPWLTVLALLAVSGLIALFSVSLQPGSLTKALRGFLRQPVLIALNYFPALICTAVLYFLFGNVFWAGSVTGAVMSLLSYANLLKYEGREDTLVPADIFLFREAMDAARDYQLDMHWAWLAMIAALVIGLALLGLLIRSARPRTCVRAAGAAGALLIFVLSVRFVYTDKELFNSLEVPERDNVGSVFNTLGFNYCFLNNVGANAVTRPSGYSAAEAEAWAAAVPERSESLDFRPNVIFVMCEAFSDLSEEEMFCYAPQDDPLRDYRLVCDSELSLSGHIVVSNYGAGTSNTEFDVLTGMLTDMIGERITSSFRAVRRPTDSLAGVYLADGYDSFFMHPGKPWFYNRQNVYAYLGFDDQVYEEAFDRSDCKGPMISDAAFLRVLEDCLQTRLVENENPLFAYAVTIQNHQAYTPGKYGAPSPRAQVSVPLSEEASGQLSVYLEGVRDSSAMLLELTEYLDTLEEPTILVFFGDHRPNIPRVDDELGLDLHPPQTLEDSVKAFSVPFLIRVNTAYAQRADVAAAYAALGLPENGTISDNYLGAMVLSLSGHDGHSAFFDYLNAMRRELPVLRPWKSVYILSDGTFTQELSPQLQAQVDKLDKWSYYILRH